MAWQRFRVELKGEAEPLEVQTNARDWSAVPIDPGGMRMLDMTWRAAHNALVRTGANVPRDYDGFLEVLEGMPEPLDAEDDELLNPTDAPPSDGPR